MNLTSALSVIDFTTLARVKALTNASISDTSQDTLTASIISMISAQFVDYLGLHALEVGRTEVYEVRAGRSLITLDARPIDSSTALAVKIAGDASDFAGIAALDASSYAARYAQGQLRLLVDQTHNPGYAQITYTGGLGTATTDSDAGTGIVERFPQLAYACDMQVKYAMQRQDGMGGSAVVASGQGTSYTGQYQLLDQVREILDANRRW